MYSSTDSLLARTSKAELIQITWEPPEDDLLAEPPTEPVQPIIDADCRSVAGLIDAYVRKVASVPLNPIPDVIRDVSDDLVIYKLYRRRWKTMPDKMTEIHDQAIAVLEGIASGKIQLFNPESKEQTVGVRGYSTSGERYYTDDMRSLYLNNGR